ncbi:MAG: hypothetical protein QXD04_07480 [Candidatus Bathyarchaeia archaeon]
MSVEKRIFRGLAYIGLASALLMLSGAILQGGTILTFLGVGSPLSSISLPDPDRVKVALYLTLSSMCSVAMIWAGAEGLQGIYEEGGPNFFPWGPPSLIRTFPSVHLWVSVLPHRFGY